MIWNILTLTSVALGLLAIYLAYHFWKNPLDTSVREKRIYEDEDTTYIAGINHKGWLVRKIKSDLADKGESFEYVADFSNNPEIKKLPDGFDKIKSLKYRNR